MKIAVIGAGAFGSWTAFHLQKAGHHVTLIDRHGPGNPKASSGGEARMIRSNCRLYTSDAADEITRVNLSGRLSVDEIK